MPAAPWPGRRVAPKCSVTAWMGRGRPWLLGTMLLFGCAMQVVQQKTPLERARTFEWPFSLVWDRAEQVMQGKQANPRLIDREAGLMQFVANGSTYVTIYIKALDDTRTRVLVVRNRGARISIDEMAILDDIANALGVRLPGPRSALPTGVGGET